MPVLPAQGYPLLSLWGFNEPLYEPRVNFFPHNIHSNTYLGPKLPRDRPKVRRTERGLETRGDLSVDVYRVVGDANIGPTGVSSTTYRGAKEVCVACAP